MDGLKLRKALWNMVMWQAGAVAILVVAFLTTYVVQTWLVPGLVDLAVKISPLMEKCPWIK